MPGTVPSAIGPGMKEPIQPIMTRAIKSVPSRLGGGRVVKRRVPVIVTASVASFFLLEMLFVHPRVKLLKAIAALGEAVRLDASDAVSAYNLACAHALQAERQGALPWRPTDLDRYVREGSRRKALRWLDEALRRGFDDFKLVRVDPDLSSLRDEPGFRAILQAYGFDSEAGGDAPPRAPD